MWYSSGGFWWPGFVLMAVFCIVMMVAMMWMTMGGMDASHGRSTDSRDVTRNPDRRSS